MSKYKYETWKNILTKLEVGKEYSVNNTRPDYDEFVDALKSFAQNWWNFVVKDHGTSITFVMLDPVRYVQELIDLYDEKGEPVIEEKKRDDFYQKAYSDDALQKEREFHASLPKSDIPGTPQETGTSCDTPTDSQSDDLPSSGISGHQEKDNASTGLKTSETKTQKTNEDTEW